MSFTTVHLCKTMPFTYLDQSAVCLTTVTAHAGHKPHCLTSNQGHLFATVVEEKRHCLKTLNNSTCLFSGKDSNKCDNGNY